MNLCIDNSYRILFVNTVRAEVGERERERDFHFVEDKTNKQNIVFYR